MVEEQKMRIYISGPMLGKKEKNYPLFDLAEEILTEKGWVPINPAIHSRSLRAQRGEENVRRTELLHWDISKILECDALALLPGWENSDGARVERFVAEETGKKVFEFADESLQELFLAKPWHADIRPRPERELEHLVGFSGSAQVGKDSSADLLGEWGFVKVSFADLLRNALYELDPFIPSAGRGVKTLVDECGWEGAKVKHRKVRELLQRQGTEVGRNLLGENVWVDATFKRIAERGLQRVAIADCRFPNEAKAVHMAGGKMVRVHRPGYGPVNGHPSETALDHWPFDFHLYNNGSLQDLELEVKSLAKRLGF